METVLVTGGGGFIGSSFAEFVLQRGYYVKILDDLSTGRQEVVNRLEGLGAEILIGDIRDLDLLKSVVEGVDIVVHLAAQVSVPVSVENPVET